MAKEEKSSFSVEYDPDEDMLYLLFTDCAKEGIAEEVDDEVFIRFQPENQKILDIEILNFRHRLEKAMGPDLKYVASTLTETFLVPKRIRK